VGLLPGFDVLEVAARRAAAMVAYSVKTSDMRQVSLLGSLQAGSSFAG
jgi:hypothetical protein